jgi:hypothetical protein
MSFAKDFTVFYSSTEKKDLLIFYKEPCLEYILGKISAMVRESLTSDSLLSIKLIGVFLGLAQYVYFYRSELVLIGDKSYG